MSQSAPDNTSMTSEDLAKFTAHLSRFQDFKNCPVCGTNSWSVTGIEAANPTRPTPDGGIAVDLGGRSIPMVVLICRTCFYVMQFAWRPIQSGVHLGK